MGVLPKILIKVENMAFRRLYQQDTHCKPKNAMRDSGSKVNSKFQVRARGRLQPKKWLTVLIRHRFPDPVIEAGARQDAAAWV